MAFGLWGGGVIFASWALFGVGLLRFVASGSGVIKAYRLYP